MQFDYVRFPSEGALSDMRFPRQGQGAPRRDDPALPRGARKALKPFDVKLGVDVFGLAADHDLGIGQDVARIGKHVDVISPMLYPEPLHARASSASRTPTPIPSSTVALSMGTFRSQLIASPKVKIRPWLQDFGGYDADRR